MANLGELRTAVLDNLQRVVTDSILQVANADRWINQVIRFHICTRHHWDAMEATWSINTVANQELYAYPSAETADVKQLAIRLEPSSAYMPLREESEDQLDEDIPATIKGIPVGWCRTGSAIRLRPCPSVSTYRIRARVWEYPVPLTDMSATNYWTVHHADLIEDMATAIGYRWLGDLERYGAMWQICAAELKERIENDAKRLRPSRQTVAPGMRAGRARSSAGGRLGEAYRQYNP